MRAERQAFLADIAHNDTRFHRTIYSVGSNKNPAGRDVDTVTVIFDLDWPTDASGDAPTAGDLLESTAKLAVASTIFRVKEFLERRLMTTIDLFDVRDGCIRVRFLSHEGLNPGFVQPALSALLENKAAYNVVSVSAKVGGRAVKA